MNVYVIGKFEEKETVREVISELTRAGHIITHNWTQDETSGLRGAERCEHLAWSAALDAEGVRKADAVLVLHHPQLCGGLVEFGMALADPKKLAVVVTAFGKDPVARHQPIFYWLPQVHHFQTVGAAVRFISQTEKDRLKAV